MGFHGRIVAGYAGLFAVLLTVIALGEATVVDNILVADRIASLPAVAHAVADALLRLRLDCGPCNVGRVSPEYPGQRPISDGADRQHGQRHLCPVWGRRRYVNPTRL